MVKSNFGVFKSKITTFFSQTVSFNNERCTFGQKSPCLYFNDPRVPDQRAPVSDVYKEACMSLQCYLVIPQCGQIIRSRFKDYFTVLYKND